MELDDPNMDAADKAARRLLAEEPKTIEAVKGGGNNRLFKVQTSTATVALKSYSLNDDDKWDRLAHEWAALIFLSRHMPGTVPRPIAHDPSSGWAAIEWVDGNKPAHRREGDIPAALAFARGLRALGESARREGFSGAREACLCLDDLLKQIDWRLARLAPAASRNDKLDALLVDVRREFDVRRQDALKVIDASALLPPALQVLSPSDFGFHNAIRRQSGELAFLDFEYFGWDDPVKLACDVHWHPGMALSDAERALFARGFELQASMDPGYRQRLSVYLPLIGLRWCLILLNEFLATGLARRRHAGQTADAMTAQIQQLSKARALYRNVVHPI